MNKHWWNRITALLLTFLVIMTGSFTPRAKAAETTTPLCGDANGDNWLDVRDVYAIRYSDYHQSFTYEQEKASDINGDGKCDVLDCDCILDYLVGNSIPDKLVDTNLEKTTGHSDRENNAEVTFEFLCEGNREVSVESGSKSTLEVFMKVYFLVDVGAVDIQFACKGPSEKIKITEIDFIENVNSFKSFSKAASLTNLRFAAATSSHLYPSENGLEALMLTVDIPADTPVGKYEIRFSDHYMVFKDANSDMLSTFVKPLNIYVGPKAEITEEPKGKKLLHDDTPQPLVEAGKALNGTMQYAIGNSASDAPTSGWDEKIPEKEEAGLYYIWAKAKGDDTHNDSDPICVTSTIVHKVTFRVAGGNWNDKTNEDIVLPLSRYENEDLALIITEKDIPKVGEEPAVGHLSSGSWDGTFDKQISADTVFTFTYDEDPNYVPDNYSIPSGLTAIYGQTLADVSLPDGWKWDDSDTISVGDAGEKTFSATFTPAVLVNNKTFTEVLTVSVTKVPAPKELTSAQKPTTIEGLSDNGLEQVLLTAPKAVPEGYTIEYSTDGTNWSKTIPTGKEAGEYKIQTRYVGDKNHESFSGETVTVIIKAVYTVIWLDGNGAELDKKNYVEGSTEPMTDKTPTKANADSSYFIFDGWDNGTVEGTTKKYTPSFTKKPLYTSEVGTLEYTMGENKEAIVRIIGNQNNNGLVGRVKTIGTDTKKAVFGTDVLLKEGSLIITFAPGYLDSLGAGEHMIRVVFDDGEVSFLVRILAALATGTPTPAPADTTPVTGDTVNPFLFAALISLSLAGFAVMLEKRRKKA